VFLYVFGNRAVFERYGSAGFGMISSVIGVAALGKGRRSKKNPVPGGAGFFFFEDGRREDLKGLI